MALPRAFAIYSLVTPIAIVTGCFVCLPHDPAAFCGLVIRRIVRLTVDNSCNLLTLYNTTLQFYDSQYTGL